MNTAIITYIDDNFSKNLENDFLFTLRKHAKYQDIVYVIYGGKDDGFVKRIKDEYGVEVIISGKEYAISNQRNIEIAKLLAKLPGSVEKVMCIDGGDVWFQSPLEEIFDAVGSNYGFVEEIHGADEGFNLGIISRITNQNIKTKFLERARGYKLINSGMVVGQKEKVKNVMNAIAQLTRDINQDYFALDQAIFNYVVRSEGKGISLSKNFCFLPPFYKNFFYVKNNFLYEIKINKLFNIIHNLKVFERFFPGGKPNIAETPKYLKNLPGTFWGVTTFFNPVKYKNKIYNYKKFRRSSKNQGLKLLAVEAAFNNEPFELTKDDADILIQVRITSALWQKERLLNIGFKNLPADCDKIAWIDNDVVFTNNNWVKETCELLQSYCVVQPFQHSIRLPKDIDYVIPEKINFFDKIDTDGYKTFGAGCRIAQLSPSILRRSMHFYGHTGFAWAARREVFQKNGFFDQIILPASDMLIARAFFESDDFENNEEVESYVINDACKKSFLKWAKEINKIVKGSVYFTVGDIMHLWHGAQSDRSYSVLLKALKENNFNPTEDLKTNEGGCWEWSSDKRLMHKAVRDYFFLRREDA